MSKDISESQRKLVKASASKGLAYVKRGIWLMTLAISLILPAWRDSHASITLVQVVAIGEYDKQYLVTDGVHLPMPATAQSGDVAVVWLGVGKTTSTVVAPVGWTVITGAAQLKNSYISAAAFYKVLTSVNINEEYMAFSLTGTSTTIVGFMNIYRGVDSQSPIAASAVKEDNNYVTSHPNPSLTIPVEGSWVLSFIASEGDPGSITPPSGFTARGSVWWPKVCAADNNGSAIPSGTYTAGNWTLVGGKQTVGCMVALRPAGSTGITGYQNSASFEIHNRSLKRQPPNHAYRVIISSDNFSSSSGSLSLHTDIVLPSGRMLIAGKKVAGFGIVRMNKNVYSEINQ
jgi:hypothetical protein